MTQKASIKIQLFLLALLLGSCGQKGALYLEKKDSKAHTAQEQKAIKKEENNQKL